MLTAGANDPAVIRFAPAVITFCPRYIKNVIQYFACRGSKMNNRYVWSLYNDSVASTFIFSGSIIFHPMKKICPYYFVSLAPLEHTPGYVPSALTTHICCPGVQLCLVLRLKNQVFC